jgi:hypothetical protein
VRLVKKKDRKEFNTEGAEEEAQRARRKQVWENRVLWMSRYGATIPPLRAARDAALRSG